MLGILDPKGENKNPLSGEEYSDNYKKLAEVWSQFPAYQVKEQVMDKIASNQVSLVVSGTGSGKTVLVPKYVLHVLEYTGKVAITLPKQIIAKSAAEFAAETLDVKVGQQVGYQYKGSSRSARSSDGKLLYATDGTIVARLLNDPELKEFDAVVVDEAHERKVQIDFLLYLLRETLRKRKEFKVVIMSATINAEIFKNYYQEFSFAEINIGGKTNYPIKSIFLDKPIKSSDFVMRGLDHIMDIIKVDDLQEPGAHDILFFITSANEAFTLCRALQSKLTGKTNLTTNGEVFCVEVFSGMDPEKQKLAQDRTLYKEESNYSRKVVVSTNVAESSLTIDGIKWVVESGLELSGSYDASLRARRLDKGKVSRAQAKQRMGRAGRTEPGICYHLYTKNEFDKFKPFPEPDIRVNSITAESLKLLCLPLVNKLDKLLEIFTSFIEPPREEFIKVAFKQLVSYGAVNKESGEVTPLGRLINSLPFDPPAAVAVVLGYQYQVVNDVVDILSLLDASRSNLNSILANPEVTMKGRDIDPKQLRQLGDKFKDKKKQFKHKYGDHLSLLNLFKAWKQQRKAEGDREQVAKQISEWCRDNYIREETLIKAQRYARTNSQKSMSMLRIDPLLKEKEMQPDKEIMELESDERVLFCLMYGFQDNVAFQKKSNSYKTIYTTKEKISISDNSFITTQFPKHCFFHELFISMGNADLNIVSRIPEKLWSKK